MQLQALLRCSCPVVKVVTCILGWHIWLAIFLTEQVMIKGCFDNISVQIKQKYKELL